MSNIDTQLDKLLADMPEHNRISEHELLKSQIQDLINEAKIEARLVELDLLEQAINMGLDINQYKMGRLKDLTNRGKE